MTLLDLLRAAPLPLDGRRGVRRAPTHTKRGFAAGRVNVTLSDRTALARHTVRYGALVRAANAWARATWPDFRYTTIQFNEGDSGLHVDSENAGPSVILALGDFTGGRLWTMERPTELLDARGRGVLFDGNLPHMTEPSQGERYTIVFFTMRDRTRAPLSPDDDAVYRDLGFPPITGRTAPGRVYRALLPAAAALVKRLHGFDDDAVGDYGNASLPTRFGTRAQPAKTLTTDH
jgi:hypothetical protein